MFKKPTALTASRAFVFRGVPIAKGATLTGPFPKAIQHLLARRWVVPTPPTYGPVGDPNTPTPTFIHNKFLVGLAGTAGPFSLEEGQTRAAPTAVQTEVPMSKKAGDGKSKK